MENISRAVSDIELIKNTIKKSEDPILIVSNLFLWIGGFNLMKWLLGIIINMSVHKLEWAITLNSIISLIGYIILFFIISHKIYSEKNKFASFQKLAISLIISISLILPILFFIVRFFLILFQSSVLDIGNTMLIFNRINEFAGILLFCLFLIMSIVPKKIPNIVKNVMAVNVLLVYLLLLGWSQRIEIGFFEIQRHNLSMNLEQIFYASIVSIGFLFLGIVHKRRIDIKNGD